MREVYGRRDFAIIGELVEPETRVLDLGCGEGELLAWLKEHKDVDGRGVELTGGGRKPRLFATACCHSHSNVTSSGIPITASSPKLSTAARSSVALTSQAATKNPSARSRWVMAQPCPRAAPVTSATR